MAVQVAIVREDSSPAVNSQAGGVPRAQDLAADLALRSSVAAPSAAPAQVCLELSHDTAKGMLCYAMRDMACVHMALAGLSHTHGIPIHGSCRPVQAVNGPVVSEACGSSCT